MSRIYILVFFFLIVVNGMAQQNLWYITRGLDGQDERAWGVDTDSAGNIYWAVIEKDKFPHWYYNILLYKINTNSKEIWQSNSWGWSFNDIAFIVKASGNRVYLGGRMDSTTNPNQGDALVLCYDAASGDKIWDYVWDQGYGYEEVDGLLVQSDGIYLTGWSAGKTTDMDFLVQKLDFEGKQVWSKTWDYKDLGRFDGANGHSSMDDNYIYAAGHVNRSNIASLDGEMGLACFSRINGDFKWCVTWGGNLYDDALGMTMSSDSMLYVTGYTGSFGKGSQTFLNKYSRTGELIWSRLWGGKGAEDARAIAASGDSIIFVVGATSSYGIGDYDIFVLKFDSDGKLIDSLFWGGAGRESAHDIALYGEFLYITGETNSFGNGKISGDNKADALLLKINFRTMTAPDTALSIDNNNNPAENPLILFSEKSSPYISVCLSISDYYIWSVHIYDFSGKEIYCADNIRENNLRINKSDIITGPVFISIKTDGGDKYTGKFLIE